MSNLGDTPRNAQRFCTACGAAIPEAALFCVSCGRPLALMTDRPIEMATPSRPPERSHHRFNHLRLTLTVALMVILGAVGVAIGIRVAGTSTPVIRSLSPISSAVPSAGGTVQLSGRVTGARSCTVRELPAQNIVSVSVAQRDEDCAHNRFWARVSIGPNVLQRKVSVRFQVTARDGKERSRAKFIKIEVFPAISQPSSNWAGYVQGSAKPITFVSAQWTIPEMHCASGNGALGTWIGVDGRPELNSEFRPGNNLFQAGSESECSQGQQYDFMWWEWNPVNLSNTELAVYPGDVVTAEVFHENIGGQTGWWWYVGDVTTGQSAGATSPVPYDGPAATADFVVEDPGIFGSGNSDQPFVGFSPVTFTRMLVATNSPPDYQPFTFDSFAASGVVNMVHRVGRSLRVLAEGSMPSEANDGYGTMTVTYVGP